MEVWKPIPGCPKYEASNLGRVRNKTADRILRPGFNLGGYAQYTLGKYGGRHQAHKLIMLAFVGPRPPDKPDINHINGIKADNRLENLEYCTKSYNKIHSISVLGKTRGESHGNSKITNENVREIRRLAANGTAHKVIAAQFSMTRGNISYIVRRSTWNHLSD